jgi:nucleoside-diphosphate-sugar epimerase
MRVVIAGGHGKIALLLSGLLAGQGDTAVGLIRSEAHTADLQAAGAQAAVLDLEHSDAAQVARVLEGADAAVFAAGAGPGSGAQRKYTVDLGGAVLLAQAAQHAGVRRFVQISSMGAGRPAPAGSDESWTAYIDAKTRAEEDLRARDLDFTILRPGGLTDEPGTGLVTLSAGSLPRGTVPRRDVAAVVMWLLSTGAAAGLTLELTGGATPVSEAVAAFAGPARGQ